MLKNTHLLRSPHPSSLQRTCKYASLLRISGALHLGIFEHPWKNHFFSSLLINRSVTGSDFLAFWYELAYNGINLCENEAKYSAFQPISA
jgi:hypothetical protein